MAAHHNANASTAWRLPKGRLDDLIQTLISDGFEVVAPTVADSAIVYGAIRSAAELPIGWTDRQSPGAYRLERRNDSMRFGYAVGPHSWKKYLFPPTLELFSATRTQNGIVFSNGPPEPPRRAMLGVRACELHAIAIQDRVFMDRQGRYTDPYYAKARAGLFLAAVECEFPSESCFCTSMGAGPHVGTPANDKPGDSPTANGPAFFDLAMTELEEEFLVRAGSPAGEHVVSRLQLEAAGPEQFADAAERVERGRRAISRTVAIEGIREILHRNQEHRRWDEVAERCLACTNCTMVCPTCFCSSVTDTTELSLESARRHRHWDSCFHPEFASVHGGNFRPSIRGRYRQWLTHKFASWHDQFDVSGCVGCGRCITWCPVGIDVTEELTAIQESDSVATGD